MSTTEDPDCRTEEKQTIESVKNNFNEWLEYRRQQQILLLLDAELSVGG